ncbi:mitochondrial 37S ribosomal protein uS9m [Colletotrichum truncatum]|uniref:Ribosomal protein S9/S16 n=1 Tax=Colletotrichum truncatum TaxID=5467 RepID=A0ACC3ZJL4_COLTU|nr:ribosomal protein S9/S16 [Colletotrichum truncatum]KAF6791927.1 ribosomal protein S9/S16 [Colletotrichum truncatum]
MSTIRHGLQKTLCLRQLAKSQLLKPQWQRPSFQMGVKSLSTIEPKADQSAPTIDSSLTLPPEEPFQGVSKARPVPVSPSYFSREPHFNDAYIKLSALLHKHQHLPTAPPELVPRQLWKTLKGYRTMYGEPVKALPYSQILAMVKRLHQIHPRLMPREVQDALQEFKRDIDPFKNVAKVTPLDKHGRALGVGRRKTSTARAWVVEGTGEVLVNGKPLHEVFGRIHDRESAIWALRSTARTDKYNVWALVDGGGVTGQAEALTLAIAKAVLAHEPDLKKALRKAGCITRDARTVERKKHGHVKARKMPAWVKR